jgi:hypothetical protein
MSATQMEALESVSEDWQTAGDERPRPGALIVQLRRYAHVLPYFRFVCAEGDNHQVRIVFASHLVTVTGQGLASLLAALASQAVVRLIQPTESEASFGVRGVNSNRITGPSITEITVEEVG